MREMAEGFNSGLVLSAPAAYPVEGLSDHVPQLPAPAVSLDSGRIFLGRPGWGTVIAGILSQIDRIGTVRVHDIDF